MKHLKSSVKKTFTILEHFTQEKPSWGITELAKHMGSNKSTIYRFLSDMASMGILEQDPDTEKYSLGLKLFELGNRVRLQDAFVANTHPELIKVSKNITETVFIATLKNNQVFYVDKVESPQGLKISSHIGTYNHLHATSLGKVLLAYLQPDPQLNILKELELSGKLAPITTNTHTEVSEFVAELTKIKEQGFALDREELEIGLICVAVPVFNQRNECVASLSASGPANRFQEEKVEDYVAILKAGADAIREKIGGFRMN